MLVVGLTWALGIHVLMKLKLSVLRWNLCKLLRERERADKSKVGGGRAKERERAI